MTPRRVAVFLLLGLGLAGCSGLDPNRPDGPPVDGNSPCFGDLEVVQLLNDQLEAVGAEANLDLATWNIEFFAMRGQETIDAVAGIIRTLQVDIWALQEIADTTEFRRLITQLPEYGGLYSPDVYSSGDYQKTAVLYRRDAVTLHSVRVPREFPNNSLPFPRAPIELDLTAHSIGRSYNFRLIVVHLNAGGAESDFRSRRAASAVLHTYLDTLATRDPDLNYIVAGDWNDNLDDPLAAHSFPEFISDPADYKFLTQALVGESDFGSFLGSGTVSDRLIDHILVNRAACPDFARGRVTTLRLDDAVDRYTSIVSDHRPVLVSAPVF